jgi:hypothetical protein
MPSHEKLEEASPSIFEAVADVLAQFGIKNIRVASVRLVTAELERFAARDGSMLVVVKGDGGLGSADGTKTIAFTADDKSTATATVEVV